MRRCVFQIDHNAGVTVKRNDGVTEKVVFAFPFPALAEINHFAESSSLEIRFKDGAHRTSSERVQLERLEEVRCPTSASPLRL